MRLLCIVSILSDVFEETCKHRRCIVSILSDVFKKTCITHHSTVFMYYVASMYICTGCWALVIASNSGDVINPRQLFRGLGNQKPSREQARGAGGWPVGQLLGDPGGRTLSSLINKKIGRVSGSGAAREATPHGRTRLLQQLVVRPMLVWIARGLGPMDPEAGKITGRADASDT